MKISLQFFKYKKRLLLFIVSFFLAFSQLLHAQCPGPNANDCDGDGVVNLDDLDDDNDGILDVDEEDCPARFDPASTSAALNPNGLIENAPFEFTTESGRTFIWESTNVTPGDPPENNVFLISGGPNNVLGKLVGFPSTSNANNAASTGLEFNVTITFPIPQTTFRMVALDYDLQNGNPAETMSNFSVLPSFVSPNGIIDSNGVLGATSNNQDIEVEWEFEEPLSSLSFTVGRPTSGFGIRFQIGFNFCDQDNDAIISGFDLDTDGDGCSDATEAGFTDANNDGVIDGVITVDADGLVIVDGTPLVYTSPIANSVVENLVIDVSTASIIPSDATINLGATQVLTASNVTATRTTEFIPDPDVTEDATAELLYEWFKDGVSQGPPVVGDNTFTITEAVATDEGEYSVIISHPGRVGCPEELNTTLTVMPCDITDITAVNISVCDSAGTPSDTTDDTFTADITVVFSGPHAIGNLDLTGAATESVFVADLDSDTSHTFTDVVLPANGTDLSFTATFSNGATCTFTNASTLTAPEECSNVIEANPDDFSNTPLASGGVTPSVITDDTLDGSPVVLGTGPGEVTLNGDPNGTNPAGFTFDPLTGEITIAEGTPSGLYTLEYEICENGADPENCSLTTVTVNVENPIDAIVDDFTNTPLTVGESTADVTDNDTLNGVPVVLGTGAGEVALTVDPNGTNPSGLTLDPLTGEITVDPNTPSGTYEVEYQICENGADPENCDITTATVLVSNQIVAMMDDFSAPPLPGGGTTPSVTADDTFNGAPVVLGTGPGEVTLNGDPNGTNPAGFTFDPLTGEIMIAEGTPSDSYTLEYEICENGADPENCSLTTVTINVENPIDAIVDDFTDTPLTVGESTADVTDNDTLNGAPVVLGTGAGEVTLTVDPNATNPSGLTLDPLTGEITVDPNTPSGTYVLEYQICENGADPENCDITTATVLVENPIDAIVDDFTDTPLTVGESTADVTDNDTLNGVPVVLGTGAGEVTLTVDPNATNPSGLTLDPLTGEITVDPNTPSGTYVLEYQICENGADPENCDITTATVLVENPIDAIDDPIFTTNGGETTPTSVIDNDLFNGVPAVIGTNPGEVNLTPVTIPTGIILNPDGTVTVGTDVEPGNNVIVYEICENSARPRNCDRAEFIVFVPNPELTLVKTASVGGNGLPGDVITYTFTVTNTGNVDVFNIVVNDALTNTVELALTPNSLTPGGVSTGIATYVITQADLDRGYVDNTATVSGSDSNGVIVNDISDAGDELEETEDSLGVINDDPTDDPTVVPLSGIFDLAITINLDEESTTTPVVGGAPITYELTLSNLGDIPATNVNVESLIPNGFRLISATATRGNYSSTDGVWTVPTLAPGEVQMLEIVVDLLGTGNYDVDALIVESRGVEINDNVSVNNRDNIVVEPLCLTIFNEFSPNGDGINETFFIGCIENFPNNTLEIYNRWGNIVYRTNNYQNDWEGESNGRAVLSVDKQLPEGTYYYILDLGDGSTPIANWLYINR